MGVLVRGQGNTGVAFGFVISKQAAPLCGFEKSNAEERIERPLREGLVTCWVMLRLAFQSVVRASRPRVCAGDHSCDGRTLDRSRNKVKAGKPSGHVCERQD